MEQPLLVVDRLGRELAGPRVLQRPGRGRRRGGDEPAKTATASNTGRGGLRLAVGAPVEDADPDALVVRRRHAMAAELEVDRLVLVAHPLVRPDLRQPGEDQPRRRRPARPPARSSRPSPRTAGPAAPAATDRAPRPGDRPACGARAIGSSMAVEHSRPSRSPSRGRAGEPRRPRGRAPGPRSSPCAARRSGVIESARRVGPSSPTASQIGRHDRLLRLQERLHRLLEGEHRGVDLRATLAEPVARLGEYRFHRPGESPETSARCRIARCWSPGFSRSASIGFRLKAVLQRGESAVQARLESRLQPVRDRSDSA